MTLNELSLGFDRLAAVRDCQNLMCRYLHFHTMYCHTEYIQSWAKRDDDLLQMPWGGYVGFQGVIDAYITDDEDRYDGKEDTLAWMRGNLDVHTYSTGIIEVAADGETAHGICMSPGFTTFGGYGKPHCMWAWSKYSTEYIKEDGVWKLWKMRLYGLFKAPYDQPWSEAEHYPGRSDGTHETTPYIPFYEYDLGTCYPDDQPAVPRPYETYSGQMI